MTPFHIFRWACDNIGHMVHGHSLYTEEGIEYTLYLYWTEIRKLDTGYFKFNLKEYREHVEPIKDRFTMENGEIKGARYDIHGELMIPMHYWDSLEAYKNSFRCLLYGGVATGIFADEQ